MHVTMAATDRELRSRRKGAPKRTVVEDALAGPLSAGAGDGAMRRGKGSSAGAAVAMSESRALGVIVRQEGEMSCGEFEVKLALLEARIEREREEDAERVRREVREKYEAELQSTKIELKAKKGLLELESGRRAQLEAQMTEAMHGRARVEVISEGYAQRDREAREQLCQSQSKMEEMRRKERDWEKERRAYAEQKDMRAKMARALKGEESEMLRNVQLQQELISERGERETVQRALEKEQHMLKSAHEEKEREQARRVTAESQLEREKGRKEETERALDSARKDLVEEKKARARAEQKSREEESKRSKGERHIERREGAAHSGRKETTGGGEKGGGGGREESQGRGRGGNCRTAACAGGDKAPGGGRYERQGWGLFRSGEGAAC